MYCNTTNYHNSLGLKLLWGSLEMAVRRRNM